MNPRRETIKVLKAAGYIFKRKGANHDIYYSPAIKKAIPVKRHDFDEADGRYICKEAGLKQSFLLHHNREE